MRNDMPDEIESLRKQVEVLTVAVEALLRLLDSRSSLDKAILAYFSLLKKDGPGLG